MKAKRRNAKGVAAIEFALVLPVFLMMLLGMMDYGWYFFVDLLATNAAREGARVATTFGGACPNDLGRNAGTAAINAYLAQVPSLAAGTTISATCSTVAANPQFRYDVTIDFQRLTGFLLVPMPAGAAPNSTKVRTSATMRGWQ